MSLQKKACKKIKLRTKRRVGRVKGGQVSRGKKLRICVFRSLNHIYAQIIDDKAKSTMASFSSRKVNNDSLDKIAMSKEVGIQLGKIAVEKTLDKNVFFDRGKYLYHGRVRALAEGLRESGLNF